MLSAFEPATIVALAPPTVTVEAVRSASVVSNADQPITTRSPPVQSSVIFPDVADDMEPVEVRTTVGTIELTSLIAYDNAMRGADVVPVTV